MVDDDDAAGEVVGLVQVLGGEQHVGATLDEPSDRVPQLDPAARVQPGCRLVEQQEPRRAHQARAEVQLPPHATGVGAHEPPARLAEPEPLEDGPGVRARLAAALPEQPGDHLEVLAPRHGRLNRRVLAGETDRPAYPVGLAADVVPGDTKGAVDLLFSGDRDERFEFGLDVMLRGLATYASAD